MHDLLPPEDMDRLRQSPRAGDQATWHLMTCLQCAARGQVACHAGKALLDAWQAVIRAITAFRALPVDQQPYVLMDLIALNQGDLPCQTAAAPRSVPVPRTTPSGTTSVPDDPA